MKTVTFEWHGEKLMLGESPIARIQRHTCGTCWSWCAWLPYWADGEERGILPSEDDARRHVEQWHKSQYEASPETYETPPKGWHDVTQRREA